MESVVTSLYGDRFINSWRRLGQGRMVLDGDKTVILSGGNPVTPPPAPALGIYGNVEVTFLAVTTGGMILASGRERLGCY